MLSGVLRVLKLGHQNAMRCFWLLAVSFAVCLLLTPAARADHFELTLKVTGDSGKVKQEAKGQQEPPPRRSEKPKRLTVSAKAGESLKISWVIQSHVKEKIEDMYVYLYVTPEKAAGDKAPERVDSDKTIVESAVTTDLEPKAKAEAELPLKITAAGTYLLRIETRNTGEKYLHEHVAEIDLVVAAASD